MKNLAYILPFITSSALAQVDSINQYTDSVRTSIHGKINSTKASIESRIDPIQVSFDNRVSVLKDSYSKSRGSIEMERARYQRKIDSLTSLHLPAERYLGKMDSLNNQLENVQKRVTAKIDSLKGSVISKLGSLNVAPEASDKINSLTSSLDKINFSSIDADVSRKLGLGNLNTAIPNLPTTAIGASIPSTNLPAAQANLPDAKLPNVQAPDLGVQNQLGKVNDDADRARNFQEQLKEAATIEGAGKAIETRVSDLEQVKAIQSQTTLPVQPPTTGEEAKEQLKDLAKKEAINHFAGKEAAVMQAMDKMSKYKQKYKNVSSIKDLPGKAPNEMRTKPFVERLLPGVALQVLMKEDFMLDVAPYAGFRLTGRLTVGAGWNQRVSFNSEKARSETNVHGPRIYGEYKLLKGLSGRMELETMNTYVTQGINADFGHREWVPAIMVGMKQQYTIYKSLRGTAFVLYNFYDPNYKSPYGDRLNARIGFEYMIKKKKKTRS